MAMTLVAVAGIVMPAPNPVCPGLVNPHIITGETVSVMLVVEADPTALLTAAR